MCQHTATLHFLFYLSGLEHSTCVFWRRRTGQKSLYYLCKSLVLPLDPAVPASKRIFPSTFSPPSLDFTAGESVETLVKAFIHGQDDRKSHTLQVMVKTNEDFPENK